MILSRLLVKDVKWF